MAFMVVARAWPPAIATIVAGAPRARQKEQCQGVSLNSCCSDYQDVCQVRRKVIEMSLVRPLPAQEERKRGAARPTAARIPTTSTTRTLVLEKLKS